MRALIEMAACLSRRHCRTCRDLEGGRHLREAWQRVYTLPGDTDFECPFGLPWGFDGAVEPPPSLLTVRQAICDACDKYGGGKCSLYDGPRCRWRGYLKLYGAICPADPPRWLYDVGVNHD